MIIGNLDGVEDGVVTGWMAQASATAVPVVVHRGKILPMDWPLPRPDVAAALGLTGDFGFRARLTRCEPGSEISLLVKSDGSWASVDRLRVRESWQSSAVLPALNAVADVASLSGATAVVAWDASHNAVGRAMALADIAAISGPVVLIAPCMRGNLVWKPLKRVGYPVLTFPWDRRESVTAALRSRGVQFDRIWISKHREPAFSIALSVMGPGSKVLWDTDDLESAMPDAMENFFGPGGAAFTSLVRWQRQHVLAQTTVSSVLARGEPMYLVPHARVGRDSSELTAIPSNSQLVGFAGSAKRHKGVVEAARAIRIFARKHYADLHFVIAGDTGDQDLRNELEASGAEIRGPLSAKELSSFIEDCRVMIAGYPSTSASGLDRVLEHQVPAKIGDALENGRPILVPSTASTLQLADFDGVYLFTENDFEAQLTKALAHGRPVALPRELTLDMANSTMEVAFRQGGESSQVSGASLLQMVGQEASVRADEAVNSAHNFVLIWKQLDAGLYGRRVDVLARELRAQCPDATVTIVEIEHPTMVRDLRDMSRAASSDASLILEALGRKARSVPIDGIDYRLLRVAQLADVKDEVETLFQECNWWPDNCTVVLFPMVLGQREWLPSLEGYRLIVDVVDNQLAWTQEGRRSAKLLEYLEVMSRADALVFNSEENAEFFLDASPRSFAQRARVIQNWYRTPEGYGAAAPTGDHDPLRILYSGNLDDRVDWRLLTRLAHGQAQLHVIGSCWPARESLREFLTNTPAVYHGPLSERKTLAFAGSCDLAVVAHIRDEVSNYMNPMKVSMYNAVGLPVVATDISGVNDYQLIQPKMSSERLAAWVEDIWTVSFKRSAPEREVRRQSTRQRDISAGQYLDLLVPSQTGLYVR